MQRQRAASLSRFDGDPQAEAGGEVAFQRQRVGIAPARLRGQGCGAALDQPLGGADVEPAAHDFSGERGRVRRGEQRAGMAG